MTVTVAVLAFAVALLTFLVAGLLRSHAAILRRLHDLESAGGAAHAPPLEGDPRALRAARDVSGVSPAGDALALRLTDVPHDTLLLFLSSRCVACQPFWDGLREADRVPLPEATRLVVVTQGPEVEDPRHLARLAPADATVAMSDDAWSEYRIPGSPYAVHVHGPTGRIRGEGSHRSWADLARLAHPSGPDPGGVPTGRVAGASPRGAP